MQARLPAWHYAKFQPVSEMEFSAQQLLRIVPWLGVVVVEQQHSNAEHCCWDILSMGLLSWTP